MKFYSKTKTTKKLGFRTPDYIREKSISRPKVPAVPKFKPIRFKVQHKG